MDYVAIFFLRECFGARGGRRGFLVQVLKRPQGPRLFTPRSAVLGNKVPPCSPLGKNSSRFPSASQSLSRSFISPSSSGVPLSSPWKFILPFLRLRVLRPLPTDFGKGDPSEVGIAKKNKLKKKTGSTDSSRFSFTVVFTTVLFTSFSED